MSTIKGLLYQNDSVEFIPKSGGTIKGDFTIDENLSIDGELITQKPPVKIVTFSDGTDIELAAMLDAHYEGLIDVADYWDIGDTRVIHLNGIDNPNAQYTKVWPAQDIVITIIAFNTHELVTAKGIRTKAAITCQTREVLNDPTKGYNEDYCLNLDLNVAYDTKFTKWSELPAKKWMNNQFLNTCFSKKCKK